MTINCDCGNVLFNLPLRAPAGFGYAGQLCDGAEITHSCGIKISTEFMKPGDVALSIKCPTCGREAIVVEW